MSDITLFANDPLEMTKAQNGLKAWCEQKLKDVTLERQDAERMYNSLHEAKMNVQPAQRAIRRAVRKSAFYLKIKAALDAGFYIIPPFDVQIFAIRTDKSLPPPAESTKHWKDDLKAKILPVGEGEYQNPVAIRMITDTRQETNSKGELVNKDLYSNTEFQDVEFPFKIIAPQLVSQIGAAMKKKIFDTLGVAPKYRNADPIVVGHINHWEKNRQPVTFFVAWWIDTRDL